MSDSSSPSVEFVKYARTDVKKLSIVRLALSKIEFGRKSSSQATVFSIYPLIFEARSVRLKITCGMISRKSIVRIMRSIIIASVIESPRFKLKRRSVVTLKRKICFSAIFIIGFAMYAIASPI